MYLLRHNEHDNQLMQDDFNEYGEKSFFVDVIEDNSGDLLGTEHDLMIKLKTYNKKYGYNINDTRVLNEVYGAIPKWVRKHKEMPTASESFMFFMNLLEANHTNIYNLCTYHVRIPSVHFTKWKKECFENPDAGLSEKDAHMLADHFDVPAEIFMANGSSYITTEVMEKAFTTKEEQ